MHSALSLLGSDGEQSELVVGEGKRDEEEGQNMTKGKEKIGSIAMKKSESCSCACGIIATSSVLSRHKHQDMFSRSLIIKMVLYQS